MFCVNKTQFSAMTYKAVSIKWKKKFKWPQIIVMFWHTAQDKFIQQVFWFSSMKFSIRILYDLGFRWRHRSGNYNCTVLTWTTLLQWSGCLVFSFQSNYTLCQQKLTGSGGMELKIARSQTSSLTFRVVSGGSRPLQEGGANRELGLSMLCFGISYCGKPMCEATQIYQTRHH